MQNPLVLCIDDDSYSLKIRELLLRSSGYATLCARDGTSGLELFAHNEVDLVILGYDMTGLSGDHVAKVIRSLKPTVPIVTLHR